MAKYSFFKGKSVFLLAGRQVKMAYVNSVAKPPRDVRRRQEKFGTSSGSSAAAPIGAAAPIKSVSSLDDFCSSKTKSVKYVCLFGHSSY